MKKIVLGSTGLTSIQNCFGALPIQRTDKETAVCILRKAYDGGMRFFDTARAYSDSEEKIGMAFAGYLKREDIIITTKTQAKTPEAFWNDLNTSLALLKTDYVDVYQFHCATQVFKPGDGTGMYECMLEAKEKGLIHHIGITSHQYKVALEAIESGLYETLQFPFSYLSGEIEFKLIDECKKHNMGFIAMKGLAGGLINNSKAAMAFMTKFDNVFPIWGIQKEEELDEWLSYNENTPVCDEEMEAFYARERNELAGDFCRGCGYCMPCPQGIEINNCARMALMLRRAPSEKWLTEEWQEKMMKIETCLHCGRCMSRCPYQLNTPDLLQRNLADYKRVLAGEVKVR